jgi:phosphatidylinositol glycan class V
LPSFLHTSPIVRHALSGILTSHLAHLGAVVTLYSIVRRMIPSSRDRKPSIAFTAACLHTLSPAGLFLSAPYGESGFALTTFLGILFYILAQEKSHLASQVQPSPLSTAAWTLLSGFSFALSTLFRTNGLLNGTIFLLDALPALSSCLASPSFGNTLHLASTLLAGLLIALAFALPQAIAYSQFCLPPSRPWCSHTIPSIYSYVQKHYWNVGFLSYWTPSNIPLFLLAAPMLAVLFITALVVLLEPGKLLASVNVKGGEESEDGSKLFTHIATQLAIPQIMLAALAITNFHVQIIVRICSGCVVWYVVLAVLVVGGGEGEVGLLGLLGKRRELLVRVMIGYAIVQGGLYASFLPPA